MNSQIKSKILFKRAKLDASKENPTLHR